MIKWGITLMVLLGAATARGEVVNATPQGFTVRHRVDVTAPATVSWAALANVAGWWEPQHTYSNDARNLRLDPVVGGCFCEKLGLYGGIEHMRVLYAEPVKHLRLEGALGPLQEFAVTGRMTWDIAETPGGARVTMTYVVGGYADRSLADLAPIVDEVLGVQVERFTRFVNSGSPDKPKP
jgi:hypothetical protein